MSWTTLHERSESLAVRARAAFNERQPERAQQLYRDAAESEQLALDELDPSKVRTRGITAVSAVALWFKGADFFRAETLAHRMLSDPTIPEFARKQLRDLVQAIWTESSKKEAGVSFLPGEVIVSVKGGEVVTGGAPLELIVDKVQTIQSIFYRTIEWLRGLPHRRNGRPDREILDACRPWLFQSAPGSFQFSVAVQSPSQRDFFQEEVDPQRLTSHFLAVVEASSRGDAEELEKLVPDKEYRRTFLKLARSLAPSGKTAETVELRAAGESKAVSLAAECRTQISAQLRNEESRESSSTHDTIELRGVLRAVHLDRDWLEVVAEGSTHHVVGLGDTVDDVIGPMVNKAVLVTVRKAHGGKLTFVDVESIEA